MQMDPGSPHFEALAPGWRDAAAAGLAAAGLAPRAALVPLTGGVSGALFCCVDTADGRFLLRLEPQRIALAHRARNSACMRAAAELGVAPAVRHSDPAAGVTVMDFIEARPLAEYPGGREAVVRELGELTARIRSGPTFPMLGDGRDLIGLLLAEQARSGVIAPGLLDRHAEALAKVRAIRPWDATALTPSHNDPNPRNLISDGQRLWLIDWELAFQNDPLFDLAIISTELADTPALQTILMTSAFGRAPDAAALAELALVRLLTRLFYGCIVLESLSHPKPDEPETSLAALTPAEFRAQVAAGRLGAGQPAATARAFGLMSLRAFLDGVAAPSFDAMVTELARR
jgi:aminoglycoside phosphotransferase (APT) family kinase protein